MIAGKDNVYQMCFSDPNQGLASAQYIAEQQLGEKIFIIWKSDDNYSTGIKDKFMAEADKLGLNVVGNATFTTDSPERLQRPADPGQAGRGRPAVPAHLL